MGNCITAPFRGNYRNRSGTRAAGRGAADGGCGCGVGSGVRASRFASSSSPILVRCGQRGAGQAWRARRRSHADGRDGGLRGVARVRSRLGASLARHDSDRKLEGCDGGERDQNRRGALMRRASQVWAIGHKARSTKLQAAATKRPNSAGSIYAPCMSSAGNIFTPCMISGPSARKTALDGKIPAPCIQNHPIAPGNGHMGRRCCHFYPKKHAWGENVASKGAYCAHSAKRERIRRDSCQMGPQVRRNARKGCEVLWGGMVGNAAEASNTAGSGVDGLGAADGGAGGLSATLAGAAVRRRWGSRRDGRDGSG